MDSFQLNLVVAAVGFCVGEIKISLDFPFLTSNTSLAGFGFQNIVQYYEVVLHRFPFFWEANFPPFLHQTS